MKFGVAVLTDTLPASVECSENHLKGSDNDFRNYFVPAFNIANDRIV